MNTKNLLMIFGTLALLLIPTFTAGQTTAVSATITDADSQAWANGTYTITFVPNPAQPTANYQYNGATMTNGQKGPYTGTLNASGVLSVSLPDNTFITPSGTKWLFTLCADTSAPCSTVSTAVSGASQSFTTLFSNSVIVPRFPALGFGQYGYSDVEVTPTPGQGGTYFNVTLSCLRTWNGSSWGCNIPTTVPAAAVAAACAAGGGTVYIAPGSYPIPTMCSNLTLIGSGKAQSDNGPCPTTLTYTGSGDAFAILSMNHIYIGNMCIKYTGVSLAAVGIHLGWGQFITVDRIYMQGWGVGIKMNCVEGQGTTGYNSFRDSHQTSFAVGGIGVLLDSTGCTNQTVNNNYWYNFNMTGGSGGTSLRIQGSGNTIANENIFIGGQWTTPSGTGISLQNSCCRNITFIGADVEGNLQGVTIGTGNSGTFINSNISANGNNSRAANAVDNSAGGMKWLGNNVAGIQQFWQVTLDGDVKVRSLCFGASACDPGNINVPAGTAVEGNGSTAATINAGSWDMAKGSFGGGSTLNFYKTVTDTPGAITVNANTCSTRAVTLAGAAATATIQIAANYSMENNIVLSPRRATAGTINYEICNITGANITLDATATFNLSVWQ